MLRALLLLLISSCGTEQVHRRTHPIHSDTGVTCSVRQVSVGAKITCPDGTEVYIFHGNNGTDGRDGMDGSSCLLEDHDKGVLVICGEFEQILYDGTDGVDGQDGTNGTDGVDGQDGTNGTDGVDGQDGLDGTNSVLVYQGTGCDRIIVSVDDDFYVFDRWLIRLSTRWLKIEKDCSVRVNDGVIETK